MSLFRPVRVASVLFIALGLALAAAPGQEGDKPAPPRLPPQQEGGKPVPSRLAPAEPVVRQVYALRGGSAKELANTLTLHYKAEGNFLAVPDTNSNTLLLSGPKAALEDALAVLREIDRPARTVHVEVLFLELAAKGGGEGGGDAKSLDLSGPSRDVRAKVRDLQQKGTISSTKTVELTALTGQSAHTQVSENKPYVTGVNIVGGGFGGGRGGAGTTSRSIAYRNVGMSVQVKPEVGSDGQVTLDLFVEDSRMKAAEGGVSVGTDDKGTAVPAAEFILFTLESRVKVRPGQIVMAQGSKSGSKAGEAQTIVLVSASLDEAGPKGGK